MKHEKVMPSHAYLSGVERYFCFSNLFSKPMSCSSVKTVRLRLPFFVLFTPSPPGSSLLRRWRSKGKWCDAEPTCRPGAPESSADPSGAPSEHDRGDIGNFRILAWSAFKTVGEITGIISSIWLFILYDMIGLIGVSFQIICLITGHKASLNC